VLARHVFREVVDGQGTAANPGSLDAVLTPRLVYMNRTEGVSGWGEAIMAIKIEWSLTRAGGQPIWIETVGGQATGLSGPTDPEKILKQCIDDVFLRSEKAISESIAIRSFAASR
jgi:hypothetical protein